MKYEWRKQDKSLYLPKTEPTVIDIPAMQYLRVKGEGNPNSESFGQCVEALYALSYGLKMLPKKGITPEGYYDYTVFPLEGHWDLNEEGREKYLKGTPVIELKDYLTYTVMIRQPQFVTEELLEDIRETVYKKKKNDRINNVILETIEEGVAVQMMHIGSYDDEPASFDRMEEFAIDNGLSRKDKSHKEIYLSDPSKVAPDKLKTTLRLWVNRV